MFRSKKKREADEFELEEMSMSIPVHARGKQSLKLWSKEIISAVKDALQKQNRTNKLQFIHRAFPPDEINIYRKLQEKIAALIPDEYNRPTILLHIRHDETVNKPDLGLLGGIGPLADAYSICKLIEKRREIKAVFDDFYVILHSSPPPRRKESGWKNMHKYFLHTSGYILLLQEFLANECDYYAMLSNTAHIHMARLKLLSDKQEGRFIHLVNEIIIKLRQQEPATVLILGTSDASKANLYPYLLKQYDIPSILPLSHDQDTLQHYIDQVKQGKAKEIADEFLVFVSEHIKSHSPSHVLFACTELSLILSQRTKQDTYKDILEAGQKAIKFIDTEEEIVNILVEKQLSVEQEKDKHLARLSEVLSDSHQFN